ncbi:hypothetical protein CN171_30875 [Sinorhizobium meliloti]|nr:hypothetical protein CN171_30875 [Sinorhizobium meliloti]
MSSGIRERATAGPTLALADLGWVLFGPCLPLTLRRHPYKLVSIVGKRDSWLADRRPHHHREVRREAFKAQLVSSTARMMVIQTIDFTNYQVCSIGDKENEFKWVRARALKTPGLAKRCSSQHRATPYQLSKTF